jgi:hypothetical protein
MTVQDLTLKFITKPAYLDMGAGKLSTRFNCTREDVYKAKIEARKLLHAADVANLEEVITHQQDEMAVLAKYMGSESSSDGTTKKYEASRPLSAKEIEDLVGADGVTVTVARVWDKMLPSGKWTYSVDVRYKVKDFYNTDELQEKLKELMPNLAPVKLPRIPSSEDQALVILITDDHVGAINITNTFGSPEYTYEERLLHVVQEARMLGRTFDEVHIVSLGDQMNGWNSQTTRGGHEVSSKSNKEQFDEYTEARVKFYNQIFASEIGSRYFVHDVENSNHTGNGFSYMANQFLNMYLQAKYPDVTQRSYLGVIGGFEYGNHVILLGHGKDEKFMKKPMPAVLDAKTDLYLYDYVSSQRYCPVDMNVTFYKGDLHQHGIQMGKFGRYVNVPALSGNSDYGDINFGNTRGGALLEVLDRTSYRISSQVIWFK